ncbi:unnamed protein product, partial [Amoebophrya sp. A25]
MKSPAKQPASLTLREMRERNLTLFEDSFPGDVELHASDPSFSLAVSSGSEVALLLLDVLREMSPPDNITNLNSAKTTTDDDKVDNVIVNVIGKTNKGIMR